MSDKRAFIKVHTVTPMPTNPVKESYICTSSIDVFAVCNEEDTRIGVSAVIAWPGGMLKVTETIEDIKEQIWKAEKEASL